MLELQTKNPSLEILNPKLFLTGCRGHYSVQLQHPLSSWVIVVRNVETNAGVESVDQQLSDHNC